MADPSSDKGVVGDDLRSDPSEHINKKRKLSAGGASEDIGMSTTPLLLRHPDLPQFNLTSPRTSVQDAASLIDNASKNSDGWQTVEHTKKKAKKIPKHHSANYPAIEFSKDSRLQSQIKLSDLQNLLLYILADGTSPQFVAVRHRPHGNHNHLGNTNEASHSSRYHGGSHLLLSQLQAGIRAISKFVEWHWEKLL